MARFSVVIETYHISPIRCLIYATTLGLNRIFHSLLLHEQAVSGDHFVAR
ncbi:MAG: hypothetical protein AAGB19_20205 [Cyanobacteria bacterium P01_F01_bin.3]